MTTPKYDQHVTGSGDKHGVAFFANAYERDEEERAGMFVRNPAPDASPPAAPTGVSGEGKATR